MFLWCCLTGCSRKQMSVPKLLKFFILASNDLIVEIWQAKQESLLFLQDAD
jgi:hypothetical protein